MRLVRLRDRLTSQNATRFTMTAFSAANTNKDGTPQIDRMITTYKWNEWGQGDQTWLDVNTIYQIMFGIRYIRQKISQQYGRVALG